jgi:DNA relaxase NicK
MISTHLDYLVAVGKSTEVGGLQAALHSAFKVHLNWNDAKPGTRGQFYDRIVTSQFGIELDIRNPDVDGNIEWRLVVPGQALAVAGCELSFRFARYLHEKYKARVTRLDWAIDDYDHTLSVGYIHRNCQRGDYKGARNYTYYASGKRGFKDLGETIYIGSEQSDKRLRAYDKNYESKGRINAFRVEYQLRDDIANYCYLALVNNDKYSVGESLITSICLGFYGLVKRTSHNLYRCSMCQNWAKFVDKCGGQKTVSIPRKVTTIEEKQEWIERQVIGTLTLLALQKGAKNLIKWIRKLIKRKVDTNVDSILNLIKSLQDLEELKDKEFCELMEQRETCNSFSTA